MNERLTRRPFGRPCSTPGSNFRICPNPRSARESLVLALVIGIGAVEDEDKKADDLVAALPHNLPFPQYVRRGQRFNRLQFEPTRGPATISLSA